MPDLHIRDLSKVLRERALPTVTVFNRLEARPRTRAFTRALRAEVRDPLWMLSRQWQLGEFEGDDAGSPLLAKLQLARTELTRYRPGEHPSEAIAAPLPLEARVERRPLPLGSPDRLLALDVRLAMGRYWLKLVAGVGDHRDAFIEAYPVTEPDPMATADADRAAHPEAWQAFAAAAGRAMDGGALLAHLAESPAHHAYDGVAGIDPGDHAAIDDRAQRFRAWIARTFAEPEAADAWDPARLEYSFACSAPARTGGETVYVAEEHHGGHLDWWAFDSDPEQAGLGPGAPADPAAPVPVVEEPRTMIPANVTFEGMPSTRWWAFEDRRTNFGSVDAATTDLAQMLFVEFALVYANDWFVIPADLPYGSIAEVRGLAVTNVFGERTWVEPAGAGPDDDWQRWSLFGVSVRGEDGAADTRLLVPPVVPKIQEGPQVENVTLLRDEMSNMVWGVEQTVPLPSGDAKRGIEAARETLAYHRRLAGEPPPATLPRVADIAYRVMTSVPENWIPFIPVHTPGSVRDVQLQRASLPRTLGGAGAPDQPEPVEPRTTLLREGLPDAPYHLHEEEVPRAGIEVAQGFQRTRWRDGRVVMWLAARRRIGRGEGTSGLAFDQIVDVPPEDGA
jgi:hypothetical protein